jgi:hypothetical protein
MNKISNDHNSGPSMTHEVFFTEIERPSAFYDFVQIHVHHVQMRVQTRRLAHGPF